MEVLHSLDSADLLKSHFCQFPGSHPFKGNPRYLTQSTPTGVYPQLGSPRALRITCPATTRSCLPHCFGNYLLTVQPSTKMCGQRAASFPGWVVVIFPCMLVCTLLSSDSPDNSSDSFLPFVLDLLRVTWDKYK